MFQSLSTCNDPAKGAPPLSISCPVGTKPPNLLIEGNAEDAVPCKNTKGLLVTPWFIKNELLLKTCCREAVPSVPNNIGFLGLELLTKKSAVRGNALATLAKVAGFLYVSKTVDGDIPAPSAKKPGVG